MPRIQIPQNDSPPSRLDKVIGSDADNSFRTKNYLLGDIFALFNDLGRGGVFNYAYTSDQTRHDIYTGLISTPSGELDPNLISSIRFSREDLNEKDARDLLLNYEDNKESVVLQITDSVNSNSIAVYSITSVTPSTNYIDVGVIRHRNFNSLTFVVEREYSLSFDYTFTGSITGGVGASNTSQLVNDGEDGANPFISLQDLITSHTGLTDTGTNTHAQIDTHIADSTIHFTQASITITESQISDLQSYLTEELNDLTSAVVWDNVPDVNITQSSVTQHQSALSINWSQITSEPTTLSGYGISDTKVNFNTALSDGTFLFVGGNISDLTNDSSYLTDITGESLTDLSDVEITIVSPGEIIKWSGTNWINNTLAEAGIAASGDIITDHTALSNIGTNTHAQIDTHIADSTIHFTQASISITESQISDLQSYLLAADINTFAELDTIVADKPLVNLTDGGTFATDISVPDEVYGVGWNGSLEVPTKNAIYDKIESLPAVHDAVTVTDSSEIDFTLTGQEITASIITGSIDVLKLDAGVQASLALADSALQSGDNISELTNDSGYISSVTGDWTGTFDGQEGTYYLDYTNFTNTPTIPTTLPDLTDVVSATNTNRFVLVANGTTGYVGRALVEADISDLQSYLVAADLTGYLQSSDIDTFAELQSLVADETIAKSGDNVSIFTNDAGYITATLTDEEVQDIVGAMVSTNTETRITVTYQDTDGTLDFVVDDDLSNYDNTTSGFLTSSDLSGYVNNTGTPLVNQIAVFTDADTIGGSANFTLSSTDFSLDVGGFNNGMITMSNAGVGIIQASTSLAINSDDIRLRGAPGTPTLLRADGSIITIFEQLTLGDYGVGTYTGTQTALLGVTAAGLVVEDTSSYIVEDDLIIASTATGGSTASNGANTWAKIATYNITNNFSGGNFLYAISGSRGVSSAIVFLAVKVRRNASTSSLATTINILGKSETNYFDDDSFKLIWTDATDIELWIKKNATFGAFEFRKVTENFTSTTVTYETSSPWQAAEPTGTTGNLLSEGLVYGGDKVFHAGLPEFSFGTDSNDSAFVEIKETTQNTWITDFKGANNSSIGNFTGIKILGGGVSDYNKWVGIAAVGESSFGNSQGMALYTNGTSSGGEKVRITNGGDVGIGTTSPSEKLEVDGNVLINGVVRTEGYTVASLPTGTIGDRAYVTDATATTFMSTVAGGGAITVPVFYDGSNWVIG